MPGDVRQTVRREFDRLLMDEERDRDARIDDACKRDARIGELLKKRTLTMTNAYAQALSEHRAPDRDAIRAEYARIDAEIAARLNALNLPGDYLQMRYRCPVCHDLGYVGDAGRHDCECFRARLDEERRKRARLDMAGDDTFEAFNADIFSPEPLPGLGYSQRDFMLRVKKLCMAYCDEFPNNRKRSLIFTGAPGLGKTFLLNCMANQLYSRGVGVSYLTAYRMLGAMRESFLETNTEPFNIMIDAELLMIDDLGSEPIYRNVTIEMLFTLLNERMRMKRHTIIATNLNAEQMQARYGDRVASRLMDTKDTMIIGFAGGDVRTRRNR